MATLLMENWRTWRWWDWDMDLKGLKKWREVWGWPTFFLGGYTDQGVVERPWQERRSTLSLVRWVQGAKMIKNARHELYDRQGEVCLLFGPGGQPSWSSAMCLASLLQGRLISKDFSSGQISKYPVQKSVQVVCVWWELEEMVFLPSARGHANCGQCAWGERHSTKGILCWLSLSCDKLDSWSMVELLHFVEVVFHCCVNVLNPFPNIAEGMRTECQRAAN